MTTLEKLAPYYNYEVNINGEIFKNGKSVKQYTDKYGYLRVNVTISGVTKLKLAHRIIAEVFIPNSENKTQVNHVNGIKTDNRVENLEWVTLYENRAHAVANDLHKFQLIEVFKNGKSMGVFKGSYKAAKKFNLDPSAVIKCSNGKYKTTKGYEIKKV